MENWKISCHFVFESFTTVWNFWLELESLNKLGKFPSLVLSKSFKNFPTLPVICQPQFYFLNSDPNFRTSFHLNFNRSNLKNSNLSFFQTTLTIGHEWGRLKIFSAMSRDEIPHVDNFLTTELLKVVRVRNRNEFELF